MAEIDRVNSAITAFFESSGDENIPALKDAIDKCVNASLRHYGDTNMADEDKLDYIQKTQEELEGLIKNLPEDRDAKKTAFQEIALKAMIGRRSTYPLVNKDRPWDTQTPKQALLDPVDAYAFAIFDTLAEDIQALAPALYQLAVEGDWEEDDADDLS